MEVDLGVGQHRVGLLTRPVLEQLQLGLAHDQRDHDLDDRVAALLLARDRGLHQRAHLHAVEAGLQNAEAHAARAQHRVRLPPELGRAQQLRLRVAEPFLRLLDEQLLDVGEELVQRGVEQPHRDRQAVHRLEDPDEVGLLLRAQLLECGVFVGGVVGEDHALHDREPVAEEHVLGAAEADALRAELPRALRVFG